MYSYTEDVNEKRLNDLTLALSPKSPDLELLSWLRARGSEIDRLLGDTPALLFRGFDHATPDLFAEFSGAFAEPLDYVYRSTPRTDVNKGIYTATEYPSDMTIPQHCENAYQKVWPLRISFYCESSAETGGETPLSDVAKVTRSIPDHVKDKFRVHGVMYVRNYSPGMDIPWQTVFQTQDKGDVEAYCASNSIEWEWVGTDSLRTRQICQGMAVHPLTHEELWFNQAHLFHASNLEAGVRDFLLQAYSESGLPRNAFYGNGDPIDEVDLEVIRHAFEQHMQTFAWEDGDILLVDNMRCSHGRNPFTGERKVLVSMNTPVTS